ncbi:MAG: type II secretion system protein XpsH [Stenotrophomonas sp.]|uniref:type II secretion system protein XpsH n=1 Tax=Stenotrophomonas sp. TaxID=69392 RepID=UPI003D6D2D20
MPSSLALFRRVSVRATTSPRRGVMAGLSLLEMMLVLALIAAISLLAAAALNGGLEGMRLRSAGKSLAAELRHARTRAIATGVPQQFELDVRTHRWKGPEGRHGELPTALSLRYTGAQQLQRRSDVGVVRFFEDGASSGGRIELIAKRAVWRIDIGWITGEVRSGPLRGDGA